MGERQNMEDTRREEDPVDATEAAEASQDAAGARQGSTQQPEVPGGGDERGGVAGDAPAGTPPAGGSAGP